MKALLLAMVIFLFTSTAGADTFFNSSEPGCELADRNPDYLWCDDVENANGFIESCRGAGNVCCTSVAAEDTCGANGAGDSNPNNDGWDGRNGYGVATNPGDVGWPDRQGGAETNFQRCGNKGAGGTNCTGTTGVFKNACGANGNDSSIARHRLAETVLRPDDFYIRFYRRHISALSGANNQKWLTIEDPSESQGWGILKEDGENFLAVNQICSDTNQPGCVGETTNHNPNISQPVFPTASGKTNWWYVEWHIGIGTNSTSGTCNGVLEIWADDCGDRGDECPETETLRTRFTDMCYKNDAGIKSLFFETWGNPANCGEEHIDQFIASRSFVGHMIQASSTPSVQGITLTLYEKLIMTFRLAWMVLR